MPELLGHFTVVPALRTAQDNPCSQGQRLGGSPAPRPHLESLSLLCTDHQAAFGRPVTDTAVTHRPAHTPLRQVPESWQAPQRVIPAAAGRFGRPGLRGGMLWVALRLALKGTGWACLAGYALTARVQLG